MAEPITEKLCNDCPAINSNVEAAYCYQCPHKPPMTSTDTYRGLVEGDLEWLRKLVGERRMYTFQWSENRHEYIAEHNARIDRLLQALASISPEEGTGPVPIFGGAQVCGKDDQACYVGRDTDDARWRCGTVACGALAPGTQVQREAVERVAREVMAADDEASKHAEDAARGLADDISDWAAYIAKRVLSLLESRHAG
jgi:hypothetical protein